MLIASLLDIVIVFVFATRGILMTAISIGLVVGLVALVLVYLVAVDSIKIRVFRYFGFQVALGIRLTFSPTIGWGMPEDTLVANGNICRIDCLANVCLGSEVVNCICPRFGHCRRFMLLITMITILKKTVIQHAI